LQTVSEMFRNSYDTLIPVPPLKNLTPMQDRYLNDESHRFMMVAAGRRSRKTLIGKRKTLCRALENKKVKYFCGAPTYNQAKKIFWEDLKATTRAFRTYKSDSDLFVRLLGGTEIHVIGLDEPSRIEGIAWNGCHITEFADCKPETWSSHIRPVLADTRGWAILDGVPEPGNILYKEMIKYACGGTIPVTQPFYGAFAENPDNPDWCFYSWFSSDVLPKKEIEEIEKTTDPKTYRVEYEGSFENLEPQVYYNYKGDYYPNGNLDRDIMYNKDLPIVMGFDFNVNPMTAVLGHIRTAVEGPNKGRQEYLLFKGYYLENSNTKSLCERIITDFNETDIFYLTPCQSSSSRQTVADIGVTDLRIARNVFAEHSKVLHIRKRNENPLVKNRIQAENAMLFHRRVRIKAGEQGLKFLIRDFEGMQYKEGASDLDLTDKKLGHISAACDYVVEYFWPIKLEHKRDISQDIYI